MFEVVSTESARRRPLHGTATLMSSVVVHLAILGGLLLLPRPNPRHFSAHRQERVSYIDVPAYHPPSSRPGEGASGGAPAPGAVEKVEEPVRRGPDIAPPVEVPERIPPPVPKIAGVAGGSGLRMDTVATTVLSSLAEEAAERASEAAKQVPVDLSALAEMPRLRNPRSMAEWWSALYPSWLLERGVEGRAVISFIIEVDGHVSSVKLVSTTHPAFGRATLRGARKMRFQPAQLSGQPVRVRATMPVEWVLPSV